MKALIQQLARNRHYAAEAKSVMDALIEQIKQSPEYVQAQAQYTEASGRMNELTEQIHSDAESRYLQTGDKRPHVAVEVKQFDVVSFSQDGDALRDWCINRMPGALRVDVKTLEKAAKAGVVEIATIEKQPKVYIKSDLSEWMES